MSATISIDKKTIKNFFEISQKQPLLIPEYQRPYEWDANEINTLFDDLIGFAEGGTSKTDEYFLGAVVHYNNGSNQREIIDGHQRIVSLTLLFRALYAQLETLNESKPVNNGKNGIEQLIWETNMANENVDKSKLLIRSDVIGEQTEKIFRRILETGTAEPKAIDLYSKNYRLLQERCKDYCGTGTETIAKFIECLFNQVILLPIQADSQEMALTIFSTLNNRGKPLTDADILKAKIYKLLNADDRRTFIAGWQELEERTDNIGIDIIDDLFYPYMLYNRAVDGFNKRTFNGVRKYFLSEKPELLKASALLTELNVIVNVWIVAKQRDEIFDESWSRKRTIRQALDILMSYPNDLWKHAVITYYLANRERQDFSKSFSRFLRKLISVMISQHTTRKRLDIIKLGIVNLNVESVQTPYPLFNPPFHFKTIEDNQFISDTMQLKSKKPDPIKMLLKILAYTDEKQEALLPDKWQIEHIFPRKWNDNYDLNGFTADKINELVETIGNLTPFEKSHNIKASNEYFIKKRKSYKQSKIAMTQELSRLTDWRPENIINRTNEMIRKLKSVLSAWNDDYDAAKQLYDQQHRAEIST